MCLVHLSMHLLAGMLQHVYCYWHADGEHEGGCNSRDGTWWKPFHRPVPRTLEEHYFITSKGLNLACLMCLVHLSMHLLTCLDYLVVLFGVQLMRMILYIDIWYINIYIYRIFFTKSQQLSLGTWCVLVCNFIEDLGVSDSIEISCWKQVDTENLEQEQLEYSGQLSMNEAWGIWFHRRPTNPPNLKKALREWLGVSYSIENDAHKQPQWQQFYRDCQLEYTLASLIL